MLRAFLGLFQRRRRPQTTQTSSETPAPSESILDGLRTTFRRRLEAGVEMTVAEWLAMQDGTPEGLALQNIWLEQRQLYIERQQALLAQYINDALRGGMMGEMAAIEELDEGAQDAILRARADAAARMAGVAIG